MKNIFFLSLFIVIWGCSEENASGTSSDTDTNTDWLIPQNQVFDGGPGKDGIPALQNPPALNIEAITYLDDDDLVLLHNFGNEVLIFPHKILDWHEIINLSKNNKNIAVSYCPLTGSAIAINRNLPEIATTTFGVSGLLYNSNLILYDRQTESYWSQMKNQCVHGPLKGTIPENEVLVETTYKTATEMFPSAKVVSNNTGIYSTSRYNRYPYGDYRTNNNILLFPIVNDDKRLGRKERVLGVTVNGQSRAYGFNYFSKISTVYNESLGSSKIVIVGNKADNWIVAYKANLEDGVTRSFAPVLNSKQVKFKDDFDNYYNILGEVVSGESLGKRLEPVHSYMACWFAWAAFYPDTDLLE